MPMAVSMNKRWLFSLSLLLLVSIVACSASPQKTETNVQPQKSDFSWTIVLNKWEVADNLSNTKSAVQYNGDVTQIQYSEKPSEGNTFLLLELTIEKQKPGSSSIKWDHLYVKDSNGIKYFRHPNDTFLENYNFPRIKSVDLTFGKNDGFICFEIPKTAANDSLNLIYESNEGINQIPLK